jgi:hypothetical protein
MSRWRIFSAAFAMGNVGSMQTTSFVMISSIFMVAAPSVHQDQTVASRPGKSGREIGVIHF